MLTGCMLVTGSSRGIGLELIKQLVGRRVVSPKVIIATCRNPDAAGELQDLQRDHPDTVVIKRLDVTHYESLGRFVESIKVGQTNLRIMQTLYGVAILYI